jgi:hypothetical protein
MLMIQGMSGSVCAYNYMTNLQSQSGYMTAGLLLHGGNPNMNLFEGNHAPNCGMNNTWGGSAYNTAFRNCFVGVSDSAIASSGNQQAVEISATNRHMNIVGNVLGTKGVNTWYEDTPSSGCHDTRRVYYVGFWIPGGGCSGVYDPLTYSTLFRACNWDSATTTNNGIVSGGFQPSALPPSYYLNSKPSYFGSLAWPPIDPANPTYSSSRTNIPAGYRFIDGDIFKRRVRRSRGNHADIPVVLWGRSHFDGERAHPCVFDRR